MNLVIDLLNIIKNITGICPHSISSSMGFT